MSEKSYYQFLKQNTQLQTLMMIGVWLVVFLIMLYLAFFVSQTVGKLIPFSKRGLILNQTFWQDIVGFCGTAVVTAIVCQGKNRAASWLGIIKRIRALDIFMMIILLAVGIPALNQIIWWNQQFSFPASMESVEKLLRNWETAGAQATAVLLSDKSVIGLVSGILMIGCLTGLGEELLFRGSLQSILMRTRLGPHFAIWASAFIFSAIHFQFFGFVPRLLLGAFFGYLFWWSGSLWLSVIAHALNNSIVVSTSWLIANGYAHENFERLGVSENGIPFVAMASGVAFVFILMLYRYLMQRK